MSKNTVVRGMLVPSLKNKPLDGRMDVPTLDDIVNIENPYVNFIFPVAETGMWYKVTRLTDKVIDELVIPNGEIAEYETFGEGMTDKQKEDYLLKSLAEQLYLKKDDAALEYLKKTDADKDFLKKVQAELEFLKKEEAKELYQPKGNYQPAGDYATNKDLNDLRNEVTTKEGAVEVAIGESEPTLDEVKLWVDTSVTSDDDDTGGGDNGGGDEPNPDEPSKQYETVNVSISASNGKSITADVTVNGETKSVTSGSSVPFEVEYGTEYTVKVSSVDGYATPESLTFTAGQSTRNVELVYSAVLVTVTRINQTIADPDTMITRIVDGGAIQAIRANSHRYTGKVNEEGVMVLKQIDDADGTKYLDGSDAEITTLGTDVFMKLPQFFWKNVKVEEDVFDFYLAYGEKPDDSYKVWEGNDLIGVYKMHVDSSTYMGYSVSGKKPGEQSSSTSVAASVKKRGEGFCMVTWTQHCMMAMLFYSYYLTTNFVSVCGKGLTDDLTTKPESGETNSFGMSDTIAAEHSGTVAVNFWGLERWWGSLDEVMSGIMITIRTGQTEGYAELSNPTRVFPVYRKDIFITKMVLGEYIDLLPSSYLSSSNNLAYMGSASFNEGIGSYGDRNSLSSIDSRPTGAMYNGAHSRLCYKGDYIIES